MQEYTASIMFYSLSSTNPNDKQFILDISNEIGSVFSFVSDLNLITYGQMLQFYNDVNKNITGYICLNNDKKCVSIEYDKNIITFNLLIRENGIKNTKSVFRLIKTNAILLVFQKMLNLTLE